MKKILIIIVSIAFMSGCFGVPAKKIDKLPGIKLTDTHWYDNGLFHYKNYEVVFLSAPSVGKVLMDDEVIGQTPFIYNFNRSLKNFDSVEIQILPYDEEFKPQKIILTGDKPLPRKIFFYLEKKYVASDLQYPGE